jgi:hypothetical protein
MIAVRQSKLSIQQARERLVSGRLICQTRGGNIVNKRAQQIKAQFESVNAEVISMAQGCTDEQWRAPAAGENWPVAVVAHHIAVVNSGFAAMVNHLVEGNTYTPDTSMDEIHRQNAEHAREYANVGKQEVLDKLMSSGAAVVAALGKLEDRDLDRSAGVYGGNPLSVGQVVEYIVIGHTSEHGGSIRSTLGSQDQA